MNIESNDEGHENYKSNSEYNTTHITINKNNIGDHILNKINSNNSHNINEIFLLQIVQITK